MMSRIVSLFALLFILLLLVAPVAAQTATPAPEPAPAEAAPETNPAFSAMLAIAGSVFTFIELLKPGLAAAKQKYQWTSEVHDLAVRCLAAALALLIVFLTPSAANFIPAFGLVLDMPAWLAKVITALFISGGATGLWSVYRLLKLAPGGPSAALVATSGGVAVAAKVDDVRLTA